MKSYDCPFKRAKENRGKFCKRGRLRRSHHTHTCSKSRSQWCPKLCLVPHRGQRLQVGLPDFGSRHYPEADTLAPKHHAFTVSSAWCYCQGTQGHQLYHPTLAWSTGSRSTVCAHGDTTLPREPVPDPGAGQAATCAPKSCKPAPARRASKGFLSPYPIRQNKQTLGHCSACSRSTASLASCSSRFTSRGYREINLRLQGDKSGNYRRGGAQALPPPCFCRRLWPVKAGGSCEGCRGSADTTCANCQDDECL